MLFFYVVALFLNEYGPAVREFPVVNHRECDINMRSCIPLQMRYCIRKCISGM